MTRDEVRTPKRSGEVTTTRERFAPVMDVLCIVLFIVVGAGRHDAVDDGMPWFFTVFWPLTAGWVVAALVSRLYTRPNGMWLRLVVSIVLAFFIGGILRGAFTDRPYFSIFTVVGLAFLALTTYGWRLVWVYFERRKQTLAT